MNQDVLAMREQEVIALRASFQGRFDHNAFESHQGNLRALYDAQAVKIRISDMNLAKE